MGLFPKPSPTERKLDEMLEKALQQKATWVLLLPALGFLAWKYGREYIPIEQAATLAAAASEWLNFLWFTLGSLAVLLIIRTVFVTWHTYKFYTYRRWVPDAGDNVTPEMAGEMMRRIHGSRRNQWRRLIFGKEYFSFLIQYTKKPGGGKEYHFYIGAPQDRMDIVEHHILTIYSKSEFIAADGIEWPDHKARHGRFRMRRKKSGSTLALARYKKDHLPGVLNMMKPGMWVQLNFSPDSEYRLKKRITAEEKKVKAGKGYRDRSAFDREEEKSFKTRFYGNEVSFQTTLAISSCAGSAKPLATAIQAITHDVNELSFWRNQPGASRVPLPYPGNMVWTGSEIANLFHIPNLTAEGLPEIVAKRIPHTTAATKTLPDSALSDPDGYALGEMVHPIKKGRAVYIPAAALPKHWGLTGITGSGKSTVLNTLIRSFFEEFVRTDNAPGFSFIDPKRETVTIALNQLLKMEKEGAEVNWDKVHWISFKKTDHPPAMNLLHRMPGVETTVLVDQVMRVINESGFGVAAQAERLLRLSIQTLLADEEKEHTILGVRLLLMRPAWRQELLNRISKNPEHLNLVQFWEEEADGLMDASGNAIMNRIDLFTGNPFLRRIFGQPGFAFPVREWMDKGHIVFYDFGGMGEKEIALIGGYLSYLYYRVADTRDDGSRLHQFVIDEAQRVKASILPEIIAEMRSKGLALGISTQTLESLQPELQNKLVNVAGNMFVCGQGETGAKVAANAFKTTQGDGKEVKLFTESQLKELPERSVAIRTEENGRKVYTVSLVPPLDRYKPDGSKAFFGKANEEQRERMQREVAESNAWTESKARELQQKAGMSSAAIDEYVNEYMSQDAKKKEGVQLFDEEPKPLPEKPKKKPKELAAPKENKVTSIGEKKEVINLFD